jgi:amino acid adenylation domain-containing protein
MNPNDSVQPANVDGVVPGEVVTMVPATAAQREIWASLQMEPTASLAYNESLSVRLRGPLHVDRLRQAYRQVLERHDALRATFTPDGVWMCVSSATPDSLPLIDLSGLDPTEQQRRVQASERREVELPFDPVRGPLVRGTLCRLSPQEHLLLFTVHHLICDGWSQTVVLEELGALYSEQSVGEPYPFASFASDDMDGAADQAWWAQRFANGVPTVDLPCDRPRPRVRTYDADREDLVLPEDLVQALQRLGGRNGATFMATLLAGYAAFLYRLTGQEDLVVGIPAAGQARTGHDRLVGHCVSLLPVRVAVAPDRPFSELLRGVRATFLDALEHQAASFGRILQVLKVGRDPARVPLVPAVLNLDRGLDSVCFQGLDVACQATPRRYETFDLFVAASLHKGSLRLQTQYNTNLFESETICRRLAEWQTLLAGAVAAPETVVADLPVLPAGESARLVDFNRTEVDLSPPAALHQLFEAQVDRSPERLALLVDGQSFCYREIEERANQLAHRLRGMGVGPNACVAVLAERSLEMVVALYGVLKAGAGYLPLEPSDPRERLAFLLEDGRPAAIVAQTSMVDRLPSTVTPVVLITPDGRGLLDAPCDRPAPLAGPDDLAYVIYTSGSTGRPKGVANVHQGIVNRILWQTACMGSPADERVLQKTPYTFDVSLWELFWPLSGGGCLVMAPPRAHQDPARLATMIEENAVTMVHFVPSMLQAFLDHADLGRCRGVRRVLSSGEALSFDLQERFFQKWGVELHNLYGPTEAAVEVSHHQCHAGEPAGVVPIGRPVANTCLYVVDAHLQPVPIGVAGELLIGGVQVARGYVGRPALTAEGFLPDPFSGKAGSRVYRTGDRARFLNNGEVEFQGRLDDQVKVRGLRIEPGEIETVLTEHPNVRQAALRVIETRPGDVRLVAFFVPTPGSDIPASELRKHLRSRLPDYMIPQQFVPITQLPLTATGKIDRKSLIMPGGVDVPPAERVAPRSTVEHLLASIWADLIGVPVERIGVNDNFFDLGGHSLLALQAIARIHARTRIRLEPRVLILSTLEQIGERLDGAGQDGDPPSGSEPRA